MTPNEYKALSEEWESIEFYISQADPPYDEAVKRQLEIEKLMEQAPYEFNEDGMVVPTEKA